MFNIVYHCCFQTTVRDKVEQLKLTVPEYNVTDDVDDDDQKTWTQQPYAKMTQLRKTDVASHISMF